MRIRRICAAAVLLAASIPASAGLYTDDLSRCLVEKTTPAIQHSFQVLGQAAAGELFSNPEVAAMMGGLEKHLDPRKLEELGKALGK